MENTFQRIGASSNSQVGKEFEQNIQRYLWDTQGLQLKFSFKLSLGLSREKVRRFDLGSDTPPVLVECKSFTWTGTDRSPSAKRAQFIEAMYYFHLAPTKFRKMIFMNRSFSKKRGESLAGYLVRLQGHLIPTDVEVWEYDEASRKAQQILLKS